MSTIGYDRIKELITFWEIFEQENKSNDFKSFALWLFRKEVEQEAAWNSLNFFFMQEAERTAIEDIKNNFSTERKIITLLNRLYRFGRNYTKKALEGLPISTPEEYGFLATAYHLQNPSKSEIINANLVEITTGSDIIRRLINEGLLKEVTDIADKRMKRMQLTEKGLSVWEQSFERMENVALLLNGNLNDEKKQSILESLSYLDNFHQNIDNKEEAKNISEVAKKYVMSNE